MWKTTKITLFFPTWPSENIYNSIILFWKKSCVCSFNVKFCLLSGHGTFAWFSKVLEEPLVFYWNGRAEPRCKKRTFFWKRRDVKIFPVKLGSIDVIGMQTALSKQVEWVFSLMFFILKISPAKFLTRKMISFIDVTKKSKKKNIAGFCDLFQARKSRLS